MLSLNLKAVILNLKKSLIMSSWSLMLMKKGLMTMQSLMQMRATLISHHFPLPPVQVIQTVTQNSEYLHLLFMLTVLPLPLVVLMPLNPLWTRIQSLQLPLH